MRSLGFLFLFGSVASAAPKSNPAFLGIEMRDAGIGCLIEQVTTCSPARDAGLRMNDVITGMDGKSIYDGARSTCDVLKERIVAHAPGDAVSYDVRRGGEKVVVNATLTTRAEVQHRCFVGQTLPAIDVTDLDNDKRKFDLGDLRGKTVVLGWVKLNYCSGCGAVFDAVADGLVRRFRDAGIGDRPAILGLTPKPDRDIKASRKGVGSTVPIAVTEIDDFDKLTLKESERIQFMVVDCRGVIRFVAPLAPGSDDLDAAVDDLLAAVEQAERLRTRR